MKNIIVILIICSFVSCELRDWYDENEYAVCDSYCYQLDLKGQVFNPAEEIGVKSIPVKLQWVKKGCWLCPDYIINIESSGADGRYNFNDNIDTSFYTAGFILALSIPEQHEYIVYPLKNYQDIYDLNEIDTCTYDFKVFPKTDLDLTIKQKIDSTNSPRLRFSYKFHDRVTYSESLDSNNFYKIENDTITYKKTITTTVNLYTVFEWKKIIDGESLWQYDSVVCKKNRHNEFIIKM